MDKTLTSNPDESHSHNLIPLLTAIGIEGIIALVGLLQIPSESGSAVWLGFSPLRIALASFVLALILLFLTLTLLTVRQPRWWGRIITSLSQWIASKSNVYLAFVGLFTLFLVGLTPLALFVSPAGPKSTILQVIFSRAGLVLVWIDLIFFQLVCTLILHCKREGYLTRENILDLKSPRFQTVIVIAAVIFSAAFKAYLLIMEIESETLNSIPAALVASSVVWSAAQLLRCQASAWATWIWRTFLFLGGGVAWGWFINWGQGPFTFHDWATITGPRLAYLQDVILKGALPLQINDYRALNGLTTRFMGIPDVMLSPQLVLFNWMNIETFVWVNMLLLYAVGFAGLVVFAERRRLSIPAFTILFLLFNFNGHILAHIAVGHFTWTGYFLFPWLISFLFDLLEGQTGWKWVMKVSFLMLVLFLQGGYHQYVYTLILLGLLALAAPRHFWTIAKAMLFSVLLSAVRLLPIMLASGEYNYEMAYKGGFTSLMDFFESLTKISPPETILNYNGYPEPLGNWEITYYIGLAGLLFLVAFGIVMVYKNREKPNTHAVLLLPALGMLVFSFDQIYRFFIEIFAFPPFSGERVADRIFVLAVLLVLFLAVVEFQKWYDRQKPSPALLWVWAGGILLLAHDLWEYMRAWQVNEAAKSFDFIAFDASHWMLSISNDPRYDLSIQVGAVVSLISLAAIIYLGTRKRQRALRITR